MDVAERTERPADARRRWRWSSEFIISGLLAIAGGAFLVGANNIRVPPTANVVDPRFFPRVVAVLLLVCAFAHGFDVARGRLGEPEEGEDVDLSRPGDYVGLGAVSASFIAHALLVQRAGWPIAAVVLFGGASIGLGARPIWKALTISVALSVAAFVLFRIGLGVYLPGGPFESWVG